jgi:hypothetical protein
LISHRGKFNQSGNSPNTINSALRIEKKVKAYTSGGIGYYIIVIGCVLHKGKVPQNFKNGRKNYYTQYDQNGRNFIVFMVRDVS